MTESEKIRNMRQEFNKRAKRILNNPRNSCIYWDKKRIAEAIRELEDQKVTGQTDNNYTKFYKVSKINGEKVLVTKNNLSKIIPPEDYFDVLLKVHLATGHGDRHKIRSYLIDAHPENRIYIPDLVSRIFPMICNECQISTTTRRQSLPVKSRNFKRGFVNIIDMSLDPDGPYRYILHYQDCQTLFSHLRPLKDDESVTIFNELLKIFLNLGSPAILYSPLGRKFVESIVKLLHKEIACYKIIIGKAINDDDQAAKITKRVMLWMNEKKSTNWSKGVHFVQFDMNISVGENNRIPYKEMFGVFPKLGVDTTGMPEELIKSLTEDKLVEWRKTHNKIEEPEEDKTGCTGVGATGEVDTNIKFKHHESSVEGDAELPSASAEEENLLCWVCDEGNTLATETCIQCNALIHIKCGVISSDTKKITCIICMDYTPLEDIITDDAENEFKIDIKEEPLIIGCRSYDIAEPKLNIKEEPMEECE